MKAKVATVKRPEMILFDYGGTLVNEKKYDALAGTRAVMRHAIINKHGYTAEDVQRVADEINNEIGKGDPKKLHLVNVEVPNHMYTAFLYRSMGIELSLDAQETDRVFWNAAAPAKPTEGIGEFLTFLNENGIRSGVVSNIPYCGSVVKERIDRLIPENRFEFVIATSEFLFRKPNKRIFDLALEMADVKRENAWYIGDHYQCDILGALGAGLFPVRYTGVNENACPNGDVLSVSSWKELEDILLQQK